MLRIIALVIGALLLGSCSGDLIPHWAGGLPKDAPPRPGTPEYEEFQQKRKAEAERDKRNDPKPSTAPEGSPVGR
jgi:hypothetical protein